MRKSLEKVFDIIGEILAVNTTHFKLENYRYNDFEVKPEVAV